MIDPQLTKGIQELVEGATSKWLNEVAGTLRSTQADASLEHVLRSIPPTSNPDLVHLFGKIAKWAIGQMSWEALGCSIEISASNFKTHSASNSIELLWSGPMPDDKLPARRIDQALYDLIRAAKREVLLVTFAAARIEMLVDVLKQAVSRGVRVRIVVEFREASEGGISYDQIGAFRDLVDVSTVYFWPLEKRERNQSGRPGKLHAKVAQVDDCVIVSSANLTDDAFTRNLEVGLKVGNSSMSNRVTALFESLIAKGVLQKFE